MKFSVSIISLILNCTCCIQIGEYVRGFRATDCRNPFRVRFRFQDSLRKFENFPLVIMDMNFLDMANAGEIMKFVVSIGKC